MKKQQWKNATDYVLLAVAAVVATFFIGLGILALNSDQYIIYQGKEMRMSDVEEILADQLEVENPGEDLELNIYHDSED